LFGNSQIAQKLDGVEKAVAEMARTVKEVEYTTWSISESLDELRKAVEKQDSERADEQAMIERVLWKQDDISASIARLEDEWPVTESSGHTESPSIAELLARVLDQQREMLARITRIERELNEKPTADADTADMSPEFLLMEVREEFDELRHHIDLAISALRNTAA
jgi:hypothetical protein